MDSTTSQSGTEPPSGFKGAGTTDSPYDQGNAPETTAVSGTEPPSGQKGQGTVDSPYDQGNAPEQASSMPSQNPAETSTESPSTTFQGSGLPEDNPNVTQKEAIVDEKQKAEAVQEGKPVDSKFEKTTGVAADGGNFDASQPGAGAEAGRLQSLDRDISPGTLPDGSHAVTSGDKGENYEPSAMSKLKNKFHMSKK